MTPTSIARPETICLKENSLGICCTRDLPSRMIRGPEATASANGSGWKRSPSASCKIVFNHHQPVQGPLLVWWEGNARFRDFLRKFCSLAVSKDCCPGSPCGVECVLHPASSES